MDYRIFNARTDVDACDCTRGCTDTARESALKVDSGRKIPCRTGESNLRQRRDGPMLWPTELHPPPHDINYLCRKALAFSHYRVSLVSRIWRMDSLAARCCLSNSCLCKSFCIYLHTVSCRDSTVYLQRERNDSKTCSVIIEWWRWPRLSICRAPKIKCPLHRMVVPKYGNITYTVPSIVHFLKKWIMLVRMKRKNKHKRKSKFSPPLGVSSGTFAKLKS